MSNQKQRLSLRFANGIPVPARGSVRVSPENFEQRQMVSPLTAKLQAQ